MSTRRSEFLASPEGRATFAPVWQRKVGKPRSDEAKAKMSKAKKGKPSSPAAQAANTARRGKVSPAQVAANTARRGRPDTAALARKAGLAGRGVRKSDHMRAALSRARKGRPTSEEHKRALSVSHLRWWASASEEEKAARPYPRGPWNQGPTNIEVAVEALLVELGEDFESQRRMGRWVPDFVIEDRKLVIECDGSYWHARPDSIERDRRKDLWMTANGYRIVRLSEEQIHNDVVTAVTHAIHGQGPTDAVALTSSMDG